MKSSDLLRRAGRQDRGSRMATLLCRANAGSAGHEPVPARMVKLFALHDFA